REHYRSRTHRFPTHPGCSASRRRRRMILPSSLSSVFARRGRVGSVRYLQPAHTTLRLFSLNQRSHAMPRFLTTIAAIAALVLIGCNKTDSSQTASDNRTAGQKTQDAVSKAGEKTGEGLGKA